METNSIKIRYWNIMDDSLLKVNSVIYIKMTQKNQQPKKKQVGHVTKQNTTYLSISSFFWRDPPAFPIYGENTNGTFPHLVAVTALSTSNCQIWKQDIWERWKICSSIFGDLHRWWKNISHTSIHYRITGDYTQMVDRWQRFRVVYYPRAYCEFWFSLFLENRSITQIVC